MSLTPDRAYIPGAVLNAVLLSGKLNICHGNVQSLCARNSNKLDELRHVLSKSKVDIACFTESWLTSKITDRSITIPGYRCMRNDRSYKRGGGIIVYYKEHLSCLKVLNTEVNTESIDKTECLALEFCLQGQKFVVVAVYNPPENDCSCFLSDVMVGFTASYDNVFMIGDFNTNLLRASSKCTRFASMLNTFSLKSVGEEPTYFCNEGCSQLDLLLTSDCDKILRFGQVSFPALSQHDLIFGSIDYDTVDAQRVITYRDYVNFDAQRLQASILSVPWASFYSIDDPDEMLQFFSNQMKMIHDTCIPCRTKSDQKKVNPWFTPSIRRAMLERDLSYKDWLKAPTHLKDQKRLQFKVLRNRVNTMITRAKEQHMDRFLDSRLPSKTLWKRVKGLGVGNGKEAKPCEFNPDEVNRTFISSYVSDASRPLPSEYVPPTPYNFSFKPVQSWEVVNAIWDIKSNATGFDGLPIKFIKLILPLTLHHVTYMFNKFIEFSSFPLLWKHAKILPLRKKPHINAITNLRPISILCALSKAFEKLLKAQLTTFINENGLLSDCQAGFRKGQGVKTAVLRVYDDLAVLLDKRGTSILLLLDFSKAFDTVSHRKLCTKLGRQFNFSSPAVRLIESYLKDRSQTVCCSDRFSNCEPVTSGVPQGSVLGPILFSCYINDLSTVLKYCSIQLYADDVQLYIGRIGPCTRELTVMMNRDLEKVADWCKRNGLMVNQSKSVAMLIRNQRRHVDSTDLLPEMMMDGLPIKWADSVNNLGYVFQNDLKWDGFVSQQCGKIYAGLRSLTICANQAPVETRLKLFKSLLLPHFLFGDSFLVNPSAGTMDRLRVALNSCVRFVYGLNRFAHVSHLQKNLLGCPFQTFYAHRSCLFLRKLMKSQNPPKLFQKLVLFRGRRSQNMVIPANRTLTYASSIFVRGIANWNSLPNSIQWEASEALFKDKCLNFWNRI